LDPSVSSERSVLAIDLGSGGPKVAVVSERGEILSSARGTVPTLFVDGGGAEQDPHDWWREVDRRSPRHSHDRRLIEAGLLPFLARGSGL